jgi:hypothetical protein
MGAVTKIRRGLNMTNPTAYKSDNGAGTGLNSSPAVNVKSSGTSGWNQKQTKTDSGTAAVGGKMDFAPQRSLSTMGKRQPQTAKGTSTTPGKMDACDPRQLNTWNIKQTKKDTGTAGK